ncbi:MAG: IPT/TIG domain-containing protein [Kofleriaceae bacterium]
MRSSSLLSFVLASAASAGIAYAQPAVRDHRAPPPPPPAHHDDRRPPPMANGPTEAPPAPREERQAARAGFAWIAGRWEWKGKWEWTAGHWERERAGKQWHSGHWDHNGTSWSWSEGSWMDGGGAVPPPNDHHPHQAPPPPRAEAAMVKAGFVWLPGRWDWKNDQWAWLDGHWERERAGKKWRAPQWQNQSNSWVLVEGEWIDASAPVPTDNMTPPPPDGHHEMEHEHHHWKIERPTVSSYWPDKGKAGSRVIVRGRNFDPDTKVMFGPEEVRAARVKDDMIEFQIPPNATTSTILLKTHGRDLIVGNYEVANFDAEAEARRIEAERQVAARSAWAAQQSKYAKDEAARRAAYDHRWQEMDADRDQRRDQRVDEIRKKWQAAFLGDPDTQDELTLHAQRVADLTRAKDVASVSNNQKLGVRIDVALAKENDRHERRMSALQTAFSSRGGHP